MSPRRQVLKTPDPASLHRSQSHLQFALLCAGLLLALATPTLAKMYEPPKSFSLQDKAVAQAQRKVLAKIDNERLLAEDRAHGKTQRPQPLRFATSVDVQFTLQNSGTWQSLADGSRLWRLRIQSAGAKNLSLGITRFDLPEGAKLWIYNPAQSEVDGPYTARNRSAAGRLWTPVIQGEEIVVELYVPAGVAEPTIQIGKVNHGYRDIGKNGGGDKSEGSCENDVICPEGNPWRDQIRSVARYQFTLSPDVFLCTGQLLNDTAQDFTPYFLSANHCTVDASNADTVVLYWNYQSPTCGTHAAGDLSQNQTGTIFRAANGDSDFRLLELSAKPDDDFHVFYSGWDASGTVPPAMVCIHHPTGDVKAISFSNSSPTTTAYYSDTPDPSATHWRVVWDSGVTEKGSSGSCIWNTTNKRCVGQLHGGPSSCGAASSDLHDFFGKLSVSWEGGGTAATRLKDWLDPGNTGVLGFDGAQPPIPGGPVMRLEQTVLDYGGVELGFAFTKAIVIHNDGDANLVVSAVSSSPGSPDLSQWPLSELVSGAMIAPGAPPLVLKQKFVPTTLGPHQIEITVTGNDPAQPAVLVQLQGSGISPVPLDSVLVLDRSGSMSENAGARKKIDALGSAAGLFANLLRPDGGSGTGDKISLVKYNDTAQVYAPLGFADDPATLGSHIADINTKLAAPALADPAGLLPQGSTAIGSGMQTGAGLLPLPPAGRKHVMVVLTDGIENAGLSIDTVLPGIHSADPALRIYSVGLGTDINPTKLQEITNVTNGYHQVSDDLSGPSLFDLETFYFKIFANASDLEIAVDPTRPEPADGTTPIIVDRARISSSDHRATFLVLDLSKQPLYDLQLVDPLGNVIGPGTVVGGVPVHIVRRDTYTIYKVVFPGGLAPAAYVGDWLLRLQPRVSSPPDIKSAKVGTAMADRLVQIGFAAAVGSDYRLGLQVLSSSYLPGSPVTVSVSLSDAGWPVREGRLSGTVTAPNHTTSTLTFYDDGTHGDPVAGDGTWTAQLGQTAQNGSYRIFVRALGHNSRGELVTREATRFITLTPPSCSPVGCGGQPCNPGPANGSSGGTGFGKPGRFFFGVLSGENWPLGAMRDRYNPASHFTGSLEAALTSSVRVGLEAGYHAFDEKSPQTTDNLGVTNLSLTGRLLGAGAYRPFVLLGIGGYHALGTWKLGGEIGLGLDVPVTQRVSLATGATFHSVNAVSQGTGRLQWIDASLGFTLAFP